MSVKTSHTALGCHPEHPVRPDIEAQNPGRRQAFLWSKMYNSIAVVAEQTVSCANPKKAVRVLYQSGNRCRRQAEFLADGMNYEVPVAWEGSFSISRPERYR